LDVLEAGSGQGFTQGFFVVDELVAPVAYGIVDDEGAFVVSAADVWEVFFDRVLDVGVLFIGLLRFQNRHYPPQFRARHPDAPTWFEHPVAFLEHFESLFEGEVFDEVFGEDVIPGVVLTREGFGHVQEAFCGELD